jgi:hypothetical protein
VFCRGRGYVGDDNEPADRNDEHEYDPYAATSTPVWDEPAVAAIPGCPQCFGTGKVVTVGNIRRPTKVVESLCLACSP